MKIKDLDKLIIKSTSGAFIPVARVAIFIIFFYFGVLKLIDQSPASPLAMSLVSQTIGAQYFDITFKLLAVFECLIGVLFLIPKATRIVVPLLADIKILSANRLRY